ncbi:MAG: hypothetical protein ACFFG0_49155 [Candidatus Thorarchaeota archaeon]
MDYGFIDENLEGRLYEFVRPFEASRSALTMENYKGDAKKDSIPRNEDPWVNLRMCFESAILDFASKTTEIDDDMARNVIDKVSVIINDFIQDIKDANMVKDRFKKWSFYAKGKLLLRIQNCNPILRKIDSMEKFSELLFNDKDYLIDYFIEYEETLKKRPLPSTLHRITLNVKRWSISDFGSISELKLENLKDKVEDVIYNWMFSNPSEYSYPYVTDSPYRFGRLQQKSFLRLEYELMQALTHAVSAHKDTETMDFTNVLNELGIAKSTMDDLLTIGSRSAKIRDLIRAKSTIVSYILDGTMTEEKLQYYDHAINKIDDYLATRHLRLFDEKTISKRGYDKKLWEDDKIKAYHIISLLCRDLGFDPLTFRPLDPLLFDKDPHTGLFARHHPDVRRKFSVYLQDLLLTDYSTHRQYDSNIPLKDQRILMEIIQNLIQNDGTGPNKEITAKDVENVFFSNFGDPQKVKYYLDNY